MLIYQTRTLGTNRTFVIHKDLNSFRLAFIALAIVPCIGTPAWGQISPTNERLSNPSLLTQNPSPTNPPTLRDQDVIPRDTEPFRDLEPAAPLPLPGELLPRIDTSPPDDTFSGSTETLCVKGFQVRDSTVFEKDELNDAIEAAFAEDATIPAIDASVDCQGGRQLTFSQILLARSAVTQLYLDNDYATSGAIIPADTPFINGIVTIQAVEGRLEDIRVTGNERLQSAYISSRLGIAARPPLNVANLLAGLQLLQLNPLIETIRADLQAGTTPGTNLLVVEVAETDSSSFTVNFNNNRSPSVGSFRRGISFQETNLLGLGDALALGYSNTDGSNELNGSYSLPISPYNTTLTAAATTSFNEVVESPFEVLEISSESSNYSLALRHPIIETPEHQFDLELSLWRQFSQTELGIDDIGPFPLSDGADDEGRTVTSALRFAQTWTQRNTKQVVSLRSQFNLGLGNFLDGTLNSDPELPDNSFFSWQGQGQWVRRLGENSLVLLRGSVQLTDDNLLSSEEFGLGGQATVRGYRQEELLTDRGVQASAEARFPILRIAKVEGVLQITPFVDFGHGWNVDGENPDPNTLVGIGTGFLWQQPNVSARLDWGIPLISASDGNDSLQESGVYFSISYSFL
ncbi:ShlB/FhaC/HecB family hemolysin secretion/activation protein [Leptolyngbyaceae cyanobacterium CCMR0082]|uniref:ShlB/FhaC/HecB family hemolysin secretion/activation protein n=1 Tax=Adonisia turfae CCMR0082 TaxID=2304604 RepID=A0A6M0SE94_9CYAN|nr:ShlB/FhaC/HecB family hemolysin secretion/activation protein [Adonisia turfae]NEZ66373.1 ShlB/FhaC/HecB family hemolysin secretion/activation protein [Adonisia turfae CCMR0082]